MDITKKIIKNNLPVPDYKKTESNQDFFNYIQSLTKNNNIKNILVNDSNIIYNLIINDYRKNVKISADNGLNKSYLCIYEVNAKYKDIIPIDSYVRIETNKAMQNKFEQFKIEPVMERIKKDLMPFKVEIVLLTDVELKNNTLNTINNAVVIKNTITSESEKNNTNSNTNSNVDFYNKINDDEDQDKKNKDKKEHDKKEHDKKEHDKKEHDKKEHDKKDHDKKEEVKKIDQKLVCILLTW